MCGEYSVSKYSVWWVRGMAYESSCGANGLEERLDRYKPCPRAADLLERENRRPLFVARPVVCSVLKQITRQLIRGSPVI
jgi:hypothetical protein